MADPVQGSAACTTIYCQKCKRATDDPAHKFGCDCARREHGMTERDTAAMTFVWLVISTNGRVMSVLDNEAAAKHVAGDHWIVECWAVRHLVEVEPA